MNILVARYRDQGAADDHGCTCGAPYQVFGIRHSEDGGMPFYRITNDRFQDCWLHSLCFGELQLKEIDLEDKVSA